MSCAIAVMAKAPRPGHSKTRLSPPLTPDEARDMSAAFLRDITENIRLAARQADIAGYVAYAPAGLRGVVRRHPRPGHAAAARRWQRATCRPVWTGFGRSLLARHAFALFARGHSAVCVLNSDSPTLPTACLVQAAQHLPGRHRPGRARAGGGWRLLPARHDGAAREPLRRHRLEHRAGRCPDPGRRRRHRPARARTATLV